MIVDDEEQGYRVCFCFLFIPFIYWPPAVLMRALCPKHWCMQQAPFNKYWNHTYSFMMVFFLRYISIGRAGRTPDGLLRGASIGLLLKSIQPLTHMFRPQYPRLFSGEGHGFRLLSSAWLLGSGVPLAC